jgi:hypothetical protein
MVGLKGAGQMRWLWVRPRKEPNIFTLIKRGLAWPEKTRLSAGAALFGAVSLRDADSGQSVEI